MLQVDKDVQQTEPASPASSVGGIHISRGVRMRIPPGGLIISDEGPGMGRVSNVLERTQIT